MGWWIRTLLWMSALYAFVGAVASNWQVIVVAGVAGGLAMAGVGVVLMRDAR